MKAVENSHSDNGEVKEEDVQKSASEETFVESATPKIHENHDALYDEVGELAKDLTGMVGKFHEAGSEMENVSNQLPFGTDELDEVGRKTEEATQKILDDSDKVIDNNDLMSERLSSLKATLFDESIDAHDKVKEDIKALCTLLEENKKTMFNLVGTLSFQDPAGQQLRKVTNMLKTLQSRILKIVVNFGHTVGSVEVSEDRQEEFLSELEYSSDGKALEQDLVDSVLKEYGF
ncbi:hypothetical protein MNBD_NITROSPIRAE01-725 [hydrothermal vent metagenome]|uniref:Chemotaxis response - phosphatase CheZ n=1 Tax=hydrothermal vent metagenome TaxID=652676 RepID=A0A3B1DFH2_9ZZZZ